MLGFCKICKKAVTPESKMSFSLYEYSYARFIEQFFYNSDKIVCLNSQCGHRVMRDINRVFIIKT